MAETRIIRDLAPDEGNHRNSEGAFIPLKDGRLLFTYSRYGSGRRDGDAADLWGILSQDGGESFGKPFPMLLHTDFEAENIMSVSFLRMENGDVGMFFLVKRGSDCLPLLVRSGDEGKTWSAPVSCGKEHGYYVVNNDRVIRLSSGRLLVPAAFHDLRTTFDNQGNQASKPGTLEIYASDDDGRTWRTLAEGISLPDCPGLTTGVQEPGLLELEDGSVWCWIRNDSGRQYQCFSRDGGETWDTPVPSRFTSPASPLSMKRLRDGRLLAVWNPVPLYNGRSSRPFGMWTGARTPLVYALSDDEGKTFTVPEVLEDDDHSGYCYVTIHETENGVLLAYCAGGPGDGNTLCRLRIRKLQL